MKSYNIVNIQEIETFKKGESYKGEITVFTSDIGPKFLLFGNKSVYLNAFSYMLVLSGRATLLVDSVEYPIDAHSLCILSPLHLTNFRQVSRDFQCLCLCSCKNFIDRLPILNIQHRITHGMNMYHYPIVQISEEEKHLLASTMEDLRIQLFRTEHSYQLEMIQNALTRYYLEIDNILDNKGINEVTERVPQTRHANILRKFISLLMLHYKTEHSVPFYARQMNITPQYLTSIIKAQTGRTVNNFICEMLYSEARNLLALSEFSIQQIATELHFSDQASFSKFFKRWAGISPLEFRNVMVKSKK
ncbi:AraC family transcriptional regulator [Butyricimonas virosa]|jgi:AraC family transcriptional activator of pobA|uniref:AraC family transcriptional regulator n=1 Tax=Butyricimonas virosa TaxID=544645 RepID=A0A413IS37_9BACT|nr:AraC family transcriptional regulator [Butyricimonas virosa]RGY20414.1 AraC family transcriptional regulator [Butyricimonas virosa]RHI24892.1 AraC family transcriptional regulator [Butyricimonas virosa]